MFMGDWVHKERTWYTRTQYDNIEGEMLVSYKQLEEVKELSFVNWLNWQCENGWEVFKISDSMPLSCIFRKQM